MDDLADRVSVRIQLTTDGYAPYRNAVDMSFGNNVDFARLIKLYASPHETGPERRYSPAICTGARKVGVYGMPDPAHISTSHVESHNQKMRQHMRQFTRLTAGHSKKFTNHVNMVSLYTVWYNYARINSAVKISPAMASGLTDRLWDVGEIVELIDA